MTVPRGLARLRPNIDESRLARLHHRHRFLDRRSEFRGILDRSLRPPAHRLRELVVLDVRIHDAGANRPYIVAQICHSISEAGESLHMHELLVVAAVVVHHGEKWDFVLRSGPQHAWCVHQVAVRLNADREPTEIAVGERRSNRGRGAVANAITAWPAEPMMVLLYRPQPIGPVADV